MKLSPLTLAGALRWEPGQKLGWAILAAAVLTGVAVLLLAAWVGDDAFVTFRVVDNFVGGYGLRFNVNERVQAYTNPLWMLLHIPFYFVWRDIYHLTLLLSGFCAVASVAIAARSFAKSAGTMACCLIAPLLFAQPWVEYAVSGLENPLSYVLFALFGWLLFHEKPHQWFWLSLVTALAMLNRLDTGLLYAPALLWAAQRGRKVNLREMAYGFLPLAAWLIFSLFYYGFLFPNTKYAKLNTGIPAIDYWRQGGHYLYDLLVTHAPGGFVLISGMVMGAWCGLSYWRDRSLTTHGRLFPVALGIGAYSLYIVSVGGDFMTGRFFALPIFAAVWLLYALAPRNLPLAWGLGIIAYLFVLQTLSGEMAPRLRPCAGCWNSDWGIADERAVYKDGNALIRRWNFSFRKEPNTNFANWGRRLRAHPPDHPVIGVIGMTGYFGGPNVMPVDPMALSDPLLARLPIKRGRWRIGHFARAIPPGYIYALKTGSTERMDPNLAQYYEKLRLIISGDLWDWQRIKTIAAFNLGVYDHWREDYLKQQIR